MRAQRFHRMLAPSELRQKDWSVYLHQADIVTGQRRQVDFSLA
jgi:hypothetical protein